MLLQQFTADVHARLPAFKQCTPGVDFGVLFARPAPGVILPIPLAQMLAMQTAAGEGLGGVVREGSLQFFLFLFGSPKSSLDALDRVSSGALGRDLREGSCNPSSQTICQNSC